MKINTLCLFLCSIMIFLCSCAAQKTAPHMGFGEFDINTAFSRSDIVVLDRVEGSSTTDYILLGIIQIVDGKNVRIFGIPFFKEKYATSTSTQTNYWDNPNAHRAYYKALEATPEADAIFEKSMDYEFGGVPPIWWTETATYSGKAIKLRPDKEQK
jgi:hypothetical protein